MECAWFIGKPSVDLFMYAAIFGGHGALLKL